VFALYSGSLISPDKISQTVQTMINDPRPNIEMHSYYPELLYKHGAHKQAREEIIRLTHKDMNRREYPEVSFAMIGAMVNGLMGIEPGETEGAVTTISRLCTDDAWAEMRSIPVHGRMIDLRHTGRTESVLRNRSDKSISWIAGFLSNSGKLNVNGKSTAAEKGRDAAGDVFDYVKVTIGPHESKAVQVQTSQ